MLSAKRCAGAGWLRSSPELFVPLSLVIFSTSRIMATPKVSVITIGRNNREGYARTLDSVASQTDADFEFIVIDGASTDGSVDLLRQYAPYITHLVSEPDRGIYNAMNKGIALARGEYCNFMNSGDVFHAPDVLSRVIPHLQGKDFYIGDQLDVNGKSRIWAAPCEVRAFALVNKSLSHQSAFIRTALLKKRPYCENYKLVSDWEQMVYELLICDATYERLDFIVADFDRSGISSAPEYQSLLHEEMQKVIDSYFSKRMADSLIMTSPFQRKVRYALDKENLLERDWKILRNVLKEFPKDLWHSLTRRKRQ